MTRQSSANAERAADILLLLGEAVTDGMSLGSIAEALGEAKSAVHRSLVALKERSLVTQNGSRGSYRLGPAIYALANRVPALPEIVSHYRPALIAITGQTNRSSFLMMRSGTDVTCIDMQVGVIAAQPFVNGIGGRIPISASPSGLVLLAAMDQRSRDAIFAQNEPHFPRWCLSREGLLADIAEYEQQGFMRGIRRTHGIESLSLAIPVRNEAWPALELALSVLTPIGSLTDEDERAIVHVMRSEIARAVETA